MCENCAAYIGYDQNFNDSDQMIDGLISGWAWDLSTSTVITHSFPDSASDIGYTLSSGASFSGEFSEVQKNAARDALDMVADYTRIQFEEIGDDAGENNADGTIRFFEVTGIGTAFGYYPNSGLSGGDTAYRAGSYEAPKIGNYEYATIMHELGHGLGLKHGHDTGGPGALPSEFDSSEYSVMTYRSYEGHDLSALGFYTNASTSFPQTFMMLDIAALQRMYGADFSTNSSNTVYTFSTSTGEMFVNGAGQGRPDGNKVFRTVWDGNGEDTYDLSNYSTRLDIDLRPGGVSNFDRDGNFQRAELNFGIGKDGTSTVYGSQFEVWAEGHLYNALQYEGDARSLIENAEGGSAADRIIGNDADNALFGNGGADKLSGHRGADELTGGAGGDRLFGSNGGDKLWGQNGSDKLVGGNGPDRLFGNAGADEIIGGRGNDVMAGGNQADIFVFTKRSGDDVIRDFSTEDRIEFRSGQFGSFSEVIAAARQKSDNIVIDLGGGNSIRIEDYDISDLQANDFIL